MNESSIYLQGYSGFCRNNRMMGQQIDRVIAPPMGDVAKTKIGTGFIAGCGVWEENKMVDTLLNTTLKGLGHPVARLFYGGEADTYITFQIVSCKGVDATDDANTREETIYRVNIYSKVDYTNLLESAISAFKAAGFRGITVEPETYEKDTEFYQVPIQIKYYRRVI